MYLKCAEARGKLFCMRFRMTHTKSSQFFPFVLGMTLGAVDPSIYQCTVHTVELVGSFF